MAERTAPHNREAASAALTESMRALERYKEKENHNLRVLKTQYETVLAAKEVLMNKHFVYAEKSKKDLSSEEMVNWLTPKMDLADDLIDEVFLLFPDTEAEHIAEQVRQETEAKEQVRAAEIDLTTRQSEDEKKRLESLIKEIEESIQDENKIAVGDALFVQSQLEQIDCELEALTKSWNKLKMLNANAEEEDLDEIFAVENTLRTTITALRSSANAYIKKIIPPVTKTSTNSDSSSVTSNSENRSNSSLKHEKIGLPTFNGNSRTFASFKGDYKFMVEKAYPNLEERTYVLKKVCLKGPAKTLVENIDTLTDVWERLESKYGNSNDIIHMVTSDLKNLTFKNNDDSSLVHFVDVLEKGIQDLIAVDSLSEISNSYTVDLIERKMPRRITEKWLEKVERDSIETKNKFTELVTFLKLERKQSERFIQLRDKEETSKRHKDGKDNKPNRDQSISGGTQAVLKKICIVHPNASTHFTRKCKAFLRMTVQQRGKAVMDANGCGFCLSNSHVGSACPFEGQWNNCDVSNCNKPHNRLIHGCGIQELSCATFRYGVRTSVTL